MKLPTETAVALAEASDIDKLFGNKSVHIWKQQFAHFQRMALVGDFDMAMRAVMPFIEKKLSEQHKQCFQLIYDMSKSDVLGLAVDSLVNLATDARSEKEKLAASAVLNELYGEKQLIEEAKLSDKLILNLAGKES